MGSFRQGLMARRVAVSAFAVYALLLQAFLLAAAPASSFSFPGEIGVNCSIEGTGSGAPGSVPVRHHGLCCIMACAAAACAYVGTASAIAAFLPQRVASLILYAVAQGIPPRAPLKHYFAARGPPALG
jgi:hypothetical protein